MHHDMGKFVFATKEPKNYHISLQKKNNIMLFLVVPLTLTKKNIYALFSGAAYFFK